MIIWTVVYWPRWKQGISIWGSNERGSNTVGDDVEQQDEFGWPTEQKLVSNTDSDYAGRSKTVLAYT